MALGRQSVILGALLAPVTLFLGVFFLLPLLIIAVFSVLSPGLYGGVEWSFYHWNYGRIFGWADGIIEVYEPVYLQILLRSLSFAALTVVLTLILCYPVAFWVSRLPDRWRLVFLFLITLPFFSSLIVRLYAWLLILKPTGLLNTVLLALGLISEPLEILYTPTAVVLGMVYVMVPFMFLPLYAAVDNLDRTQIEASLDLGATRAQTFRKVVLPQTLPGIMGGAVIVFIPSVGNFVVPDVLGGAKGLMIGNLVEQQFLSARNWPFGSALSMIIMAVVLTVLLVAVTRAKRVAAMRNPAGWAALTIFSLAFFAFIYAPLFVIIGYSFNANPVNMMIWEGFTLDWYTGLFGLSDRVTGNANRAAYIESTDQMIAALKTSLTVALFTTTISTVIGTATAIALARYRFRARGFYNGFLMLPMMMPDIVLGIGLLIFFVTIGMNLSLLTIIIGHCTFLTSYVFIIVQARIAGIDPALEEASADLGASEWTTLRKVLLPQLAPGILGGALLAFVISMDDLVITYFVSGTGDTTLPVFIFGMIRRGVKPEINAIATLMILASVVIAALGLWLRSRKTD